MQVYGATTHGARWSVKENALVRQTPADVEIGKQDRINDGLHSQSQKDTRKVYLSAIE